MDRKSIIVLVLCFILMLLWWPLLNRIFPPKPLPPGATNTVTGAMSATNQGTLPPSVPGSLEAGTNSPRVVATPNAPEELQEWTNNLGTNPIAHYTFTSHGGGIKEIELLRYPETVATRIEAQPEHPRVATLNKGALVPTLAVLDGYAVQGDGVYTLTRLTNGMRAEKTLTNGLVLTKDFEFTSNYVITAKVRLENRSTKPLPLPAQEWVVGTATPLGPRDNGRGVGVMWYNGNKSQEVGGSTFFSSGGCTRRVAPLEYRNMGASNAVWAASYT